jgi:tRNA (guanosine-2'-O-)-methyltransferase
MDASAGDQLRLLGHLLTFITPGRRQKFEETILSRTRHLTVILEDIYQPHNASAVLRTCDVFGVQDVHIIENRNKYEVNPDVALGASKWLTLLKYNRAANNTPECLESLKRRGYRVFATSPHQDDYTPETIPLNEPLALLFGTELEGLSPDALALSDGFVKIPMFGFTESLNISVSAAILLHALTNRLRHSGLPWQLPEPERTRVLLAWTMNSVKRSDLLAKDFLAKTDPG